MDEQKYYIEAGQHFRMLRESKGISQFDLAERTGFNQALISKFENHGKKLSMFRIKQLLKAIDCTLADLDMEPDSKPAPEKKTPSTSLYLCQPVMA